MKEIDDADRVEAPLCIEPGQLSPETLQNLIEEFVTRDGTDYGASETSLEAKIATVQRQLHSGRARIVFDSASNHCDIVDVESLAVHLRDFYES